MVRTGLGGGIAGYEPDYGDDDDGGSSSSSTSSGGSSFTYRGTSDPDPDPEDSFSSGSTTPDFVTTTSEPDPEPDLDPADEFGSELGGDPVDSGGSNSDPEPDLDPASTSDRGAAVTETMFGDDGYAGNNDASDDPALNPNREGTVTETIVGDNDGYVGDGQSAENDPALNDPVDDNGNGIIPDPDNPLPAFLQGTGTDMVADHIEDETGERPTATIVGVTNDDGERPSFGDPEDVFNSFEQGEVNVDPGDVRDEAEQISQDARDGATEIVDNVGVPDVTPEVNTDLNVPTAGLVAIAVAIVGAAGLLGMGGGQS